HGPGSFLLRPSPAARRAPPWSSADGPGRDTTPERSPCAGGRVRHPARKSYVISRTLFLRTLLGGDGCGGCQVSRKNAMKRVSFWHQADMGAANRSRLRRVSGARPPGVAGAVGTVRIDVERPGGALDHFL